MPVKSDNHGKRGRERTQHLLALRLIKALNALLMTAAFAWVWYFFYSDGLDSYYRRENWLVILVFFLLYVLLGRTYEAFLVSYCRISEMIYSQALSFLIADAAMFVIVWLHVRKFPKIWPFLILLLLQSLISILWCTLAHQWYFRRYRPKRTLVVWDTRRGMQDLIDSYGLNKKFEVVGSYTAKECIGNLSVLDGMDAVFLSGVHSRDRNVIIKYCVDRDITSFIIPRVGDVMMSGAKRMHMFHLPILRLDRYNPSPEYLFLKRFFDIVFSAIALAAASPVMLVTAIQIRSCDGGPVFYRQRRLTKDGREFYVLKFRSMRTDAEKDGVARLSAGENDDRITPVGRRIRAHRIDELPQLINILKGDMAIVGPRPERPEIAAQYERDMPEFRLRLQAKCGLTGYAQVYGKYNTTPYDKLQMDLMYIAHPSLAQDLEICFATIKILFMKDSTEGIAEGQTTAAAPVPEDGGEAGVHAAERGSCVQPEKLPPA